MQPKHKEGRSFNTPSLFDFYVKLLWLIQLTYRPLEPNPVTQGSNNKTNL